MSGIELNKGIARPASPAEIDGRDIDDLMDDGLIEVGGRWYTVEYEIEAQMDEPYVEDVRVTSDGEIHFLTIHYNGCEGLGEVIERAVKNNMAGQRNLEAASRDASKYDTKYFTDAKTGKIWMCEGVLIRDDDLYYSMVEAGGQGSRIQLSFVGDLIRGHGFVPMVD